MGLVPRVGVGNGGISTFFSNFAVRRNDCCNCSVGQPHIPKRGGTMDRRGFVFSVATAPIALCFKDLVARDHVCYLRVQSGRATARFEGQSFEPQTERQGGDVVILDDLPPLVHVDMKSLLN